MRIKHLLLFCLLIIAGCSQKNNTEKEVIVKMDDSVSAPPRIDTIDGIGPQWANDIVLKYVKEGTDDNIQAARSDSTPIEWIFDHVEETDTAAYYVYHIGNDHPDHFATMGWIYIDSARRSVYQYDVAADSIYLWRQ